MLRHGPTACRSSARPRVSRATTAGSPASGCWTNSSGDGDSRRRRSGRGSRSPPTEASAQSGGQGADAGGQGAAVAGEGPAAPGGAGLRSCRGGGGVPRWRCWSADVLVRGSPTPAGPSAVRAVRAARCRGRDRQRPSEFGRQNDRQGADAPARGSDRRTGPENQSGKRLCGLGRRCLESVAPRWPV